MDLEDFKDLLGRILAGWLGGSRDIWRAYSDRVAEIAGRLELSDVFRLITINPFDPLGLEVVDVAIDLIEATAELGEDLGLLWPRIIAEEVEVIVPLPRKFSNRLMRADQAVGWVLQDFLQTAIDVVDLDAPALLDAIAFSARMKGLLDAIRAILEQSTELGNRTLRAAAIKAVMGLIVRAMTVAGVGLVITTLWIFVSRIWSEPDSVLAERALPQDSRRIRARRPRRRQFRVNRRTGADRS